MVFDVRDTISGAFGSVCLVYAGLPFDTLKLRLQTHAHYRGLRHCLTDMVRTEGPLSLWKGATPALASAMIENSVVFTANGIFKRLFSAGDEASLTLWQHACIGGLSGVFSATAICPAEVVKCRTQYLRKDATHAAASPFRVFADIVRGEGVRGAFAGLSALLARDIPFNFIFFGAYRAYSFLLQRLSGRASHEDLHELEIFLAGGLAGSTAWTFVFPFDSIKSRMQVAALREASGSASRGAVDVLRGILAEGGLPLLFRGWSAAVLRAFPANAALFLGYEVAQRLFRTIDQSRAERA